MAMDAKMTEKQIVMPSVQKYREKGNTPFFTELTNFEKWLNSLGYANSTVYQLPKHVNSCLSYLKSQDIEATQIDHKHLQSWLTWLQYKSNERRGGGLSIAYINKHIQAIKLYGEYLQKTKNQYVDFNLRLEVREEQETTILTEEEIQSLYEATTKDDYLQSRDEVILELYYSLGLRRSEGRRLNLKDINFKKQVAFIRNPKNRKDRLVPFTQATKRRLTRYVSQSRQLLEIKDKQEALLLSSRGRRMCGESIHKRLKVLQQRSDNESLKAKDISLHTLRHSIATHLLQRGMAIEHIGKLLGHSSLESTQIYTHIKSKYEDEL